MNTQLAHTKNKHNYAMWKYKQITADYKDEVSWDLGGCMQLASPNTPSIALASLHESSQHAHTLLSKYKLLAVVRY